MRGLSNVSRNKKLTFNLLSKVILSKKIGQYDYLDCLTIHF